MEKYENIELISNLNTLNLREFKKEKPLSYCFLCLQNYLNNSGMELYFINQDQNRIYIQIRNKINNFLSRIFDLDYNELKNMNIYSAEIIKKEIWNKTI